MRKMHELSKYRQNEYAPKFEQAQQKKSENNANITSFLSNLGTGNFTIDSDIALILGLVLILAAENSDKMLLLALLYILL